MVRSLLRYYIEACPKHRKPHTSIDLHLCAAEDAAFPATPRGLSTLAESPSEYGAEDHEAQPARPRHMINRRELRISRRQLPDSREPEKPEVRDAACISTAHSFNSCIQHPHLHKHVSRFLPACNQGSDGRSYLAGFCGCDRCAGGSVQSRCVVGR